MRNIFKNSINVINLFYDCSDMNMSVVQLFKCTAIIHFRSKTINLMDSTNRTINATISSNRRNKWDHKRNGHGMMSSHQKCSSAYPSPPHCFPPRPPPSLAHLCNPIANVTSFVTHHANLCHRFVADDGVHKFVNLDDFTNSKYGNTDGIIAVAYRMVAPSTFFIQFIFLITR